MRIPFVLAVLAVFGLGGPSCSSGESTPLCPAPGRMCDGVCRDVIADRDHCGSCGARCRLGERCVQSRCVLDCPSGQTACGALCVDLQQDRAHCGRCGNACAPGRVCLQGHCSTDCASLTTCLEVFPDGREELYCAQLALDRLNCGACGVECPAGHLCRAGRCVLTCPAGQVDCGGRCVDVQTDRLHCGACDAVCASGFECVQGRCVVGACPMGTTLCAGNCVDLTRDRDHCGACHARCPSGYHCSASECRLACGAGETLCASGCTDLANDPRNCGACGRSCTLGERCRAGACTVLCPTGQMLCAGRCTDVSRDRAHCGACGRACAGSLSCVEGVCRDLCPMGQARCGAFCYDLRSDPNHCGLCGRNCASHQACVEGVCRAVGEVPTAGPCPPPSETCEGVCTDVRYDNAHCGACGRACPGDRLCFGGACVRPCSGTEWRCPDGACADLRFDEAHCGACDRACPAGQFCVRGVCGAQAPPTRYTVVRDDPSVTFLEVCSLPGVTRFLGGQDEGEVLSTLPFPMRFWTLDLPAGAPVLVSVNGFVALTGLRSNVRSVLLPSTSAPNGLIAVHGRDLETVDPLCVATVGVAPLRRWVITWPRARARNPAPVPTSELSFQLIFSEQTDTLDMVYRTLIDALGGYTGVENSTGTAGVSGCPMEDGTETFYCTPSAPGNLRFVPAP